MRYFLFIGGAMIELVGILFVASPDLFPLAARGARWLATRLTGVWGRVLRVFGVPRTHTVEVSVGDVLAVGSRVTLEHGVKKDATLAEQVDFLLRRDKATQRDVQALGHRLDDFEKALGEKVHEAREAMAAHVATSLDAAHRAYLPLRRIGVLLLVVGLAMVTSGNFVD